MRGSDCGRSKCAPVPLLQMYFGEVGLPTLFRGSRCELNFQKCVLQVTNLVVRAIFTKRF